MGGLAVVAMAKNAPPTDSAAQRPVHPFFSHKRSAVLATDHSSNDQPASGDNSALPPNPTASDKAEDKPEDAAETPEVGRSRRRKAEQEPNQGDAPNKTRPRKRTRNSAGGDIANHFVKPETGKGDESDKPDEDDGPGSCPSADVPVQNGRLSLGTGQDMDLDGCGSSTDNPEAETTSTGRPDIVTNGYISGPTPKTPAPETSSVKPKKLLLFNPKTGTIGSPPKPKVSKVAAEELGSTGKKPPGRRGRKPASKIVRITYGTDPKTRVRLGEMINTILNGDTQHAVASSKRSPTSSAAQHTAANSEPSAPSSAKKQSPKAPRTIAPTMTTHPFFLGQPKKSEAASVDAEPKKPTTSPLTARTKHYHVTPCSPRKPRAGSALPKPPVLRFGVKTLGLKFPGAQLPAWPWQGVTHVRGGDIETLDLENEPLPLVSRKSKGNAVKVSPGESVVSLVIDSRGLAAMAKAVRNINTDIAVPPPPELRLPQKHFESGSKLQAQILSELKTFQRSLPVNLASHNGSAQSGEGSIQAPPQLARLFDSISSSLSAFDMSQCETANWVQKYAPTSAVEVLQPGREAFFLKEWLQALMVQSVDTGSAGTDKPKAASKAKAAGAGKKKRRKKLDGFIVSSEDENYEVYELSDDGDDWAPSGSRGILRKTVVRSGNLAKGKDGVKTANTLVISGPPGCGKTAAVYAVAKELDFEVFEINASTRRSGKDVLEKIGDMTRNHHVQQHQSTATPGEDDQDAATEDDTAKDIKSGKQPTMNAFFKAKGNAPKPRQPSKSAQPAAKSLSSEAKKEPSKNQRQSLILLEEVDVLYDEDKQFWTTITGLIAQAKRPFIMTCNDETLVPLHTLPLHGIFRLSTPPRDLSVDRLILTAANEGHALTRQSVEQLYDSRNRDLRAATMDLQYWCQIGVGDRRGGFDWFFNRWPKGVDLDENKEVVRVVSENTYQPGMNLLGRDSIVDDKASPRLVEEEVLHQAWESWGFDLGHWQDTVGLTSWAEGLEPVTTTREARLGALEAYDSLAEAMSAADVCSLKAFAAFKEEAFDTTQPELAAKTQDDFVLGITHLETPIITHYDTLTTSIPSTIKSVARCSLQLRTEKLHATPAPDIRPLDEAQTIHHLQTNFTCTPSDRPAVGRMDFAFAFDPIATPDTGTQASVLYLEPSVFDRTLKLITLDVAPYVRSIVAYDSQLQRQRLKMSSLVSEGGRGAQGSKRMRTTRAALSALEGGTRSTTRGERWFKADINPYLVAKTAGEGWSGFWSEGSETLEGSSMASLEKSVENSAESSPRTSPDTTPTKTLKKAVLKGRKRNRVLQDDDDDADELGC